MTNRKSRSVQQWAVWAGYLIAVGGAAWYVYKNYSENQTAEGMNDLQAKFENIDINNEEDHKKRDSNEKPTCFVVSKSTKELFNWSEVLSDGSGNVAVTIPGVTIEGLDPNLKSKIVSCSLMGSVWSCIRHLEKDVLVLAFEDFEDVPEDLHRYVSVIKDPTVMSTSE